MKNNQWEIRREDNNGTLEQEPLSILIGDILQKIDQLKNDIEEIGGEEKFEEMLSSDESVSIIYKAQKDRINSIIIGILGVLLSASASAGVVNVLETFQDEATRNTGIALGSMLAIAGGLMTIVSGIGIASSKKKIINETDRKNLDQV